METADYTRAREEDEESEDLKPKRPPLPVIEAPRQHSAPVEEPPVPFITRDPKDEDLYEAAVRDETDLYAAWAQKSVGYIFRGALFSNQHLLISCFTGYTDDVYRRSHRFIVQFFSLTLGFYLCSLIARESTDVFVVAGLYSGTITALVEGFLGYAFKHFFLTDYDLLDLLDEVHPMAQPRSAHTKLRERLRRGFVWGFCGFLIVASAFMLWAIVLFCDRSNKDQTNYYWFFAGVLGVVLDNFIWQPLKIWWESAAYRRELNALVAYARSLEKPRREKPAEAPRVRKPKPAPQPAPAPTVPAAAVEAVGLAPLTAVELGSVGHVSVPPETATPGFMVAAPVGAGAASERSPSADPRPQTADGHHGDDYNPSAVLI
eukprot:tig00020629_g12338.t1